MISLFVLPFFYFFKYIYLHIHFLKLEMDDASSKLVICFSLPQMDGANNDSSPASDPTQVTQLSLIHGEPFNDPILYYGTIVYLQFLTFARPRHYLCDEMA